MNNLQSLSELQPQIIEWAKQRNILFPENASKQRLKLIEECGELASAILKNDVKLQKDAIGDIFVVLIILGEQLKLKVNINGFVNDSYLDFYQMFFMIFKNSMESNTQDFDLSTDFLNDICTRLSLDLTECANIAWNEIKDRTGKTVDGTFIKD